MCFPNSDSVWKLPVILWRCVILGHEMESKMLLLLRTAPCVSLSGEMVKILQMSVQIPFSKWKKSRLKIPSLLQDWGVAGVRLPGIWLHAVIWNLQRSMQIIAIFKLKSSQRGGYYVITCLIVLVKNPKPSSEHICCPRSVHRNDSDCSLWQIIWVYLHDSAAYSLEFSKLPFDLC